MADGKDRVFKPGDLNAAVVSKAGNLEAMTYPKGMKFEVKIDFSKELEKQLLTDKLLSQDLFLGVKAVYDDLVTRIADNLKKTDVGAVMLRNNKEAEKLKKLIDVVNRGILGAIEIAQDKARKSVEDNFKKLQSQRKEYTKYKIKIVVTITGAAVGLATSIALLAATGFSGGASGVIGIISMTKSVATIATEVISAAMTVEQSMSALEAQLVVVSTAWAKSKTAAVANEVGAAVMKEFLGLSLPSAKSCQSNLDTATSKLGGLDVTTHDMAKRVTKLMGESKTMQNDFLAKATEKLKKHPDPQALQKYGPAVITKLQKAVKPGEDQIKKLILDIYDNIKRIDAAKLKMDKLKVEVDKVNKIRSANKASEIAFKLLDNSLTVINNGLLGALSGNGLVSGAQSIAANVVPVAALFAYDKISAVVFADGDIKKALW